MRQSINKQLRDLNLQYEKLDQQRKYNEDGYFGFFCNFKDPRKRLRDQAKSLIKNNLKAAANVGDLVALINDDAIFSFDVIVKLRDSNFWSGYCTISDTCGAIVKSILLKAKGTKSESSIRSLIENKIKEKTGNQNFSLNSYLDNSNNVESLMGDVASGSVDLAASVF